MEVKYIILALRAGRPYTGIAGVDEMRVEAGLLLAVALSSQQQAPVGIIRGRLVEWSGTPASGELTVRTAEERLYRCSFNDKTYFERERQRIAVLGLRGEDHLELLTDRHSTADKCHARTVYVVAPPRPKPHISPYFAALLRPFQSTTDHIVARGNLTFSGIVLRLEPDRLVLRTRSQGQKTIMLREDTRYGEGGSIVEPSHLRVNTLVYVRAGRNYEGDIEAYHVVWGDILGPR